MLLFQFSQLLLLNVEHKKVRYLEIYRLGNFFLQAVLNLGNQINQQRAQPDGKKARQGPQTVAVKITQGQFAGNYFHAGKAATGTKDEPGDTAQNADCGEEPGDKQTADHKRARLPYGQPPEHKKYRCITGNVAIPVAAGTAGLHIFVKQANRVQIVYFRQDGQTADNAAQGAHEQCQNQ